MPQNWNLFEHQEDVREGKLCGVKSYLMCQIIKNKINFRLYVEDKWETVWNPKHFWFQGFQVRDIPPVNDLYLYFEGITDSSSRRMNLKLAFYNSQEAKHSTEDKSIVVSSSTGPTVPSSMSVVHAPSNGPSDDLEKEQSSKWWAQGLSELQAPEYIA